MITQWATETWPGMPLPQVVYIPHGARGPDLSVLWFGFHAVSRR